MSCSENNHTWYLEDHKLRELFLCLSAGTVITKETKELNDRVPLGALLFG